DQHRNGNPDEAVQPLVGYRHAEDGEYPDHLIVGDRKLPAEEGTAGRDQSYRRRQAGQRDDNRQQHAARRAKAILDEGGENLPAIGALPDQRAAGCPELEQSQIYHRQAEGGDHRSNDRVAGDNVSLLHLTVPDRAGDYHAEDQRAQRVHRQVALQHTGNDRVRLIGTGRLTHRTCWEEHRRQSENDQSQQQHGGDDLADIIHQPARLQRQPEHHRKVQQGVAEQGLPAAADQTDDADFIGHSGRSRRGKQRSDGQVYEYGQYQPG